MLCMYACVRMQGERRAVMHTHCPRRALAQARRLAPDRKAQVRKPRRRLRCPAHAPPRAVPVSGVVLCAWRLSVVPSGWDLWSSLSFVRCGLSGLIGRSLVELKIIHQSGYQPYRSLRSIAGGHDGAGGLQPDRQQHAVLLPGQHPGACRPGRGERPGHADGARHPRGHDDQLDLAGPEQRWSTVSFGSGDPERGTPRGGWQRVRQSGWGSGSPVRWR